MGTKIESNAPYVRHGNAIAERESGRRMGITQGLPLGAKQRFAKAAHAAVYV